MPITRRQLVQGVVPGAVAGFLLDALDLNAASGVRMVRDAAELRFVSGSTLPLLFAPVAWPVAYRLTTLMNWPNWKDFEV